MNREHMVGCPALRDDTKGCLCPLTCYPVSWIDNWHFRCQDGHIHASPKGAIGGDFPL